MAEQERPKDLDRDARLLPTVPASLGGHGMAVFERGENARWAKVLEGRAAAAIALGESPRPVETPKDIVEMVRILKGRKR